MTKTTLANTLANTLPRTQPLTAASYSPPPATTTIGFGNVLHSEWTKLRSVRSTYWTVAIAIVAAIAFGIIISLQSRNDLLTHRQSLEGFDSALTSLSGLYIAQIAFGALGVLAISSEYGTGMIRATLGAVPQRRTLLAAKGLVFGGATLVLGEILSFTAFGIGQAILHPTHAGVSLSQPADLRAAFGGGLYLAAVGMLGFGLGALIRHTAGALSAFFGVMFATSVIADLLPTAWRDDIIKYMPANAGSQIITTIGGSDALGPWQGFVVLCVYPLAIITAASWLISRRDA
jgi:ABC-2 type transport system permease protein